MPRRTLRNVLLLLALHAASRQIDAALGLLLHTTLDLPDFVPRALGLIEPGPSLVSLVMFVVGGGVLWLALAGLCHLALGEAFALALEKSAAFSGVLLLRPFLTLLALVSLALRPTYPYAFTLPVALTQDLGLAQDLATAAFLLAPTLAAILGRVRIPPPRPWEVGFLAFLAYALLTPAWARQWDSHTGNEPKTLRMAVAIGHGLTLDAFGVSAGMEDLETVPLAEALGRAGRGLALDAVDLVRALGQGPSAVGREAIRATRISRQTVRGKEGGVYYVLAPGPSALLAPFLRVDRRLNRAAGTPGRLAVTVLAWNALSALLVVGILLFVRDLTGRPGVAAAVAALFALLPPFYFYAYQFYPEMLGALALVFLFRGLLVPAPWTPERALALGLLLALLPWLHQKFLPVWAVLSLFAVMAVVRAQASRRALAWLVLPQAFTLALYALYNFSITGSIRPDALFLAWGPGGVSASRTLWGIPGLPFDSRYGLFPYAPLYLAAGAALLASPDAARRLRYLLPAVLVYFLTVASADNWSGAGCNLGRYLMPLTPWLVALVALSVLGITNRPFALGLFSTLAAWSGAMALLLGLDPHAANDCSRLLLRSVFADGAVYLPTLPLRDWAQAAPGLWWRVSLWVVLTVLAARAFRTTSGPASKRRALGVLALLLAAAWGLERYPPSRRRALFQDMLELSSGQVVFAMRGARVESRRLVIEPGEVTLLVRQREPGGVVLLAAGEGFLRLPGRRTVPLRPSGLKLPLESEDLPELLGRGGDREVLGTIRFRLDGPAPLVAEVLPP